MTIHSVLFSFCAIAMTALQAGMALWRTTYHSPFAYKRDEDYHCAEHAKMHIIPIPSMPHIKQHVSIGIAAPQKMCLSVEIVAASLVRCLMEAITGTTVRSVSTPVMWTPVKATV
ncbi:hypothetical protein [Dictyobacter alpinus]|uniref:hypothetical protein n=1 Tax=Dictyobacter alpinus TaxID=2014873 RepID=UPI001FE6B13A|nr:hypothetical protein [Dictyobacter alpinus]